MRARYAWENYQRAVLAFSSILLTFVAFICLIVAGATPGWTRIINKDPKAVAADGILVSFGLFRGEHKIDSGFSDIERGDDFDVYNFLDDDLPVWRLRLTFALIVLSFLICLPAMAVTFLSTYQTVTTTWRGPGVAYLLNLAAAFLALCAVGVYLDFFIWDVEDGDDILRAKRPDLSLRVFIAEASLWYSFVVHCVACGLLLVSLMLCWRLVVILPSFAGPVSVFKSEASLEVGNEYQKTQFEQMTEMQQTSTLPPNFQQRPSIASYEESSVLY